LDRLHDLWLELSASEHVGSRLHHRDVIGVALRRLQYDLASEDRAKVLRDLEKELRKN
jgi:hypothetical protein